MLHIKNNKSRMTGDCHVRFCERFRVKLPLPTRLCQESVIGNKLTACCN